MSKIEPKLKFKKRGGDSYPEWEQFTIKDVSVLIKDGTHGTHKEVKEGIPLLSAKDIQNGKIQIPSDCRRISKKDYDTIYKNYVLRKNDIALTVVGTIGRVANVDVNSSYAFQRSVAIIRPNIKADPIFLRYIFETENFKRRLNNRANQSAQSGVYLNELSKIVVNVSRDSEEQTKIAGFLSTLDTRINIQSNKIDILMDLKKGYMQKIFSQEIRFKREDGGEYPEWEDKKLGNIFSYKNGTSNEQFVEDNGKYYLISLNSIDIDGNFKNIHKKVNRANEFLKKDDLIMILSDVAHGNFLGLSAIIPEDNKYVLNQRVGLLRKKAGDNIKFCRYIINSNQKKFKLLGQGSSQQNLSKDDILQSIFSFPVLEEQEKIADFLSTIDSKIDIETQILSTLQTLKKGLLQQMFV